MESFSFGVIRGMGLPPLPGGERPHGKEQRSADKREIEEEVPRVDQTFGEVLQMRRDRDVGQQPLPPGFALAGPDQQPEEEQDEQARYIRDDLALGHGRDQEADGDERPAEEEQAEVAAPERPF